MDIKKALEILEINNNNITLEILKKNYHRLALQNHPDKISNIGDDYTNWRFDDGFGGIGVKVNCWRTNGKGIGC
jgi:curved DNA-binding protein CbpA